MWIRESFIFACAGSRCRNRVLKRNFEGGDRKWCKRSCGGGTGGTKGENWKKNSPFQLKLFEFFSRFNDGLNRRNRNFALFRGISGRGCLNWLVVESGVGRVSRNSLVLRIYFILFNENFSWGGFDKYFRCFILFTVPFNNASRFIIHRFHRIPLYVPTFQFLLPLID